jgi:hypothetical protein
VLQLDIDALTKRFVETPLTYVVNGATVTMPTSQRLVENQPLSSVDEASPWVRFTISPGASEQIGGGVDRLYHQLGTASLRIYAPSGTGTRQAGAIRDGFIAAFRSWRSPDNCLNVYKTNFTSEEVGGKYQINATVFWESKRTPA